MHISKSKRIAAISLLFFVCSVSVAFLVLNMIKQDGAQLEEQMELVQTNRLIESKYSELQTILDQSEDERNRLGEYLLTEDKTVRFLSEIESVAKKMGLQLTTDSLTVSPFPNQTFQKIDLRLRAVGPKDDLLLFISALETLPYYSRVEALSLDGDQRSGEWRASVALMVGLH